MALRDRYSSEGKSLARNIVVQHVAEEVRREGRVLDLWGGGQSARAIKDLRPDLSVWSAERDRTLWGALASDAERFGYIAHRGDFRTVRGLFDFIWLDLCGPVSKNLIADVAAARDKLRPGADIAVTLMPERESDEFLVRSRMMSIPALLSRELRRSPGLILRYDRGNGHEMWLLLLTGNEAWNPVEISDALEAEGEWARGPYEQFLLRAPAAHEPVSALAEVPEPTAPGDELTDMIVIDRHGVRRRASRDEAQLISALVDAKRAGDAAMTEHAAHLEPIATCYLCEQRRLHPRHRRPVLAGCYLCADQRKVAAA